MGSDQAGEGLPEPRALLAGAQRGELDLGSVELARLSRELRRSVEEAAEGVDLLAAADALQALARLLEIKMGRHLEGASDAALDAGPPEPTEEDPGARLEEYRLYRAAADVLISDPQAGPRAFLRVLGLPVEPQRSLTVSPEALAEALGALLARLPEPAELAVTMPRYSMEEKMQELRGLLAERSRLHFEALFAASRDRLEAVVLFLALLELLRLGELDCVQAGVGEPILVRRV